MFGLSVNELKDFGVRNHEAFGWISSCDVTTGEFTQNLPGTTQDRGGVVGTAVFR